MFALSNLCEIDAHFRATVDNDLVRGDFQKLLPSAHYANFILVGKKDPTTKDHRLCDHTIRPFFSV